MRGVENMRQVHPFWVVAIPLAWGAGWGFGGQLGIGFASAGMLVFLALTYIADIIS